MCSIEFTAPLGMEGNGIENNVIGCWLMLHKERVIFLLLPFFSLFSVSYLLLSSFFFGTSWYCRFNARDMSCGFDLMFIYRSAFLWIGCEFNTWYLVDVCCMA
ncbi:hypothetical protein NE237_009159 [Protea cynaroides]|uniref:Uncharacterized protein n=1 Tax=Protea cynaroides TaxID=273540 RepID=A0A9Q0KXE7_9MAGN|nr:hypothetical protein NE237_009159 [Protea cynaroides]